VRELLEVPMPASDGRVDIYSGVARAHGKLWATVVRPRGDQRDLAVLLIHPTSNFMGHYAQDPLAARGVAAVGMATRYLGNDSALLMENCVLDVGAVVRYLKDEQGYRRVVLAGNSGGGGLVALYQSQAEKPTITATPAGDPPDLTRADLPRADGLILLMAHPGRASTYTEWLDPAIVDEHDPTRRDPSLDLFNPENGPPFSPEFLARYRAGQLARNRRITAWVRERLAYAASTGQRQYADLPFAVHGTTADPRFVDTSIEPSDRQAGTLWGEPIVANNIPATLGHFSSLRSWLSQWSVDDSQCNAIRHLPAVSVPVLVVYGTADSAALPHHARESYDAAPAGRRKLVALEGATHYFAGQPEHLGRACDEIVAWLDAEGLRGVALLVA
jgi:alpha-beta hydrolase superfamily lysophospholipase